MQRKLGAVLLSLALSVSSESWAQSNFDPALTERVSFGTYAGAVESNNSSSLPKMSKNSRFVVFESTAGNLVDPNIFTVTPGRRHVYLKDRQANSVELISVGPWNPSTKKYAEPTQSSFNAAVSADGRYVAFTSSGTVVDFGATADLYLPGQHIYIRDREANMTFLADMVKQPVKRQVILAGTPQVSSITRCKSYPTPCDETDPTNLETLIFPVIETKDMWVAAFDLYPDETSPGFIPVVSDRPYLSTDGKFLAIESTATNLAGLKEPLVFIEPIEGIDYNQGAENDGIIDGPRDLFPAFGAILDIESVDHVKDIYVRDGGANTYRIVSLSCKYHNPFQCGVQGDSDATNAKISDDGKLVSFESESPLLSLDFNAASDVYLLETEDIYTDVGNLRRISNDTSRLLAGNGASLHSALSADGRYLAYETQASNIVTGDTNAQGDIIVYDTKFFSAVRCLATGNVQGNGDAEYPSLTGSGEFVAFDSDSSNWGASGGFRNIYLGTLAKDVSGRLTSCTSSLVSRGPTGTGGNGDSSNASVGVAPKTIAGTSSRVQVPSVAYQTNATNVGSATDSNGVTDIYEAPTCTASELATDTDGDGTTNCFDQCYRDVLKVVDTDEDADGYADCEDGCPKDSQKASAAVCGCGVAETDSDSDATPDCNDKCPNDANKLQPGDCGCGIADVDVNGNGIKDCKETSTPGTTPTATPTPNPSLAATPTPTSTPVPTATATPSSSPTATPTPGLGATVPGSVTLKRQEPKTFSIRLSVEALPAVVDHFVIELVRTRSGGSSTRTLTTSSNSVTIRRAKAGRYKARFKAVTASGSESLFSPYSSALRIR